MVIGYGWGRSTRSAPRLHGCIRDAAYVSYVPTPLTLASAFAGEKVRGLQLISLSLTNGVFKIVPIRVCN